MAIVEPEDLALELLRAIRGDIAEMQAEQREQHGRLAAAGRSLAHVGRDGAGRRAEVGVRFGRVLDRLDRIESRLGLRDA